jgi:hypothetical protein
MFLGVRQCWRSRLADRDNLVSGITSPSRTRRTGSITVGDEREIADFPGSRKGAARGRTSRKTTIEAVEPRTAKSSWRWDAGAEKQKAAGRALRVHRATNQDEERYRGDDGDR